MDELDIYGNLDAVMGDATNEPHTPNVWIRPLLSLPLPLLLLKLSPSLCSLY
jgi:hypothetical protein